jgi:hypothetical protein
VTGGIHLRQGESLRVEGGRLIDPLQTG